jgi:hypothetical protein
MGRVRVSCRSLPPLAGGVGALVLLGLLLLPLGLTACTNVCDEASEHVAACLSEFCAENGSHPVCARLANRSQYDQCDAESQATADALLTTPCDEIRRQLLGE